MTLRPRPKGPCAFCPYRQDVPSGIWAESEYDKLPGYDGETWAQAEAGAAGVFQCHNEPGRTICAGWAHLANIDTLALRLAFRVDPEVDVQAVLDYTTDVPLFGSGAEAAEHGKRDLLHPSAAAMRAADKISDVRAMRGYPIPSGADAPPMSGRSRDRLEPGSAIRCVAADRPAGPDRTATHPDEYAPGLNSRFAVADCGCGGDRRQ